MTVEEKKETVPPFDLLSTVDQGGCAAKLPADRLSALLAGLALPRDRNLLVDVATHDDAGVYRVSDDLALIQTVDFFPPVCPDPYEFGQVAAANAMSDVYAMGGRVLTALNLVMFPAAGIPLEVLREILRGGQERVAAAGGVVAGGHTIADSPPKYGLAVTGAVHPEQVITNSAACPGDVLVLSKPIGGAIVLAGRKAGLAGYGDYRAVLESMKQLNREGAEVMQRHRVRAATDITGFSLLGHARGMARASGVTLKFMAAAVPRFAGADALAEAGCLPGACFRNQSALEAEVGFAAGIDYPLRMTLLDAQTSGGLLMCVPPERADRVVAELRAAGYPRSARVGEVSAPGPFPVEVS